MVAKVTKAEMLPTQELRLTFESGEIRYLTTELRKTTLDKKHWIKGVISGSTASWLGAKIQINPDGSLTVNEKEKYSADELYKMSKRDYIGAIKEKEK
jgi:hypothetical protein